MSYSQKRLKRATRWWNTHFATEGRTKDTPEPGTRDGSPRRGTTAGGQRSEVRGKGAVSALVWPGNGPQVGKDKNPQPLKLLSTDSTLASLAQGKNWQNTGEYSHHILPSSRKKLLHFSWANLLLHLPQFLPSLGSDSPPLFFFPKWRHSEKGHSFFLFLVPGC